ncbi:MAG: bifunctional aspartate kinase/homoserine dehydrogenase II [Gammaproteobacteria bacterium]|nr:bifunctional aspartate kinase/homoserine dehydrogenase II [Gammaproteobacteria bacterium]
MNTNVAKSNLHPFKQLQLPQAIFKFGGSSLANARSYRKAARIVSQQLSANDLVVVSASAETTSWLLTCCQDPLQRTDYLQKIRYHHRAIIRDCFAGDVQQQLLTELEQNIAWITRQLEFNHTNNLNEIVAFGEVWSAKILCYLLQQQCVDASWIDARQYLKIIKRADEITVDYQQSKKYLFELLKSRQGRISIVTGYIASDCDQKTCLLGRNGSDYSATILAKLTATNTITLWTDVAGIYNFDPNLSTNAQPLAQLNVGLTKTLAQLGSPVLHPKTLEPIAAQKVRLTIASTFSPNLPGSEICLSDSYNTNSVITHRNRLLRFIIQANSDLEAKRIANSIQLRQKNTAEFSLLLVSASNQVALLCSLDCRDFWSAQLSQLDASLALPTEVSILALARENKSHHYYHQYFFNRFIKASVNHYQLYALEHADVAIIERTEIDDLATQCFAQWSDYTRINAVFLLGIGNVGATWLKQSNELSRTDYSVVLKSNSATLSVIDGATNIIDIENNPTRLIELLKYSPFKNKVIIDATASAAITDLYNDFFSLGAHLISANKLAASGALARLEKLSEKAQEKHCLWRQNATVGAGLPINYALNDLSSCGDKVTAIRGIFSGTLSWLLQTYDGQQPFSSLIEQAKALGYSEPDPRVDLSGQDVLRKLTILMRLIQAPKTLQQVEHTPLLPENFLAGELEQFWQQRDEFDHWFDAKWQAANSRGKRLVYQAEYDSERGSQCALVEVPLDDPLAQVAPCDNIFVIQSKWYQDNPLVIRGPGAGREVTAAAVQSDLNQIIAAIS